MNTLYAPIVIFAYLRVDRLANLLSDLEENEKIEEMELFIYVDIPEHDSEELLKRSKAVIDYLNQYKVNSRFGKVSIRISDIHKGLAKSIIGGVSEIIDIYEKVIVFEDDLRVSNDILDYFNRALDYYRYDEKIWSITGRGLDARIIKHLKGDVFLGYGGCWSWASWKDRWDTILWDVPSYQTFKNDEAKRIEFGKRGDFLPTMLDMQMSNEKYDSWAIIWNYQAFLENKYSVYPKYNRCINQGDDKVSAHGRYIETYRLVKDPPKCVFEELEFDQEIIDIGSSFTISRFEKLKTKLIRYRNIILSFFPGSRY